MNVTAALKAAAASCARRVVVMDRGWKASALGVGLLALALLR